MIKRAIHSLKSDFDRAFFYWLVFVLCSMFMFLFFHLSLSDVIGVTFLHSQNNISTTLTVFVIAICMIVIFMANDFFVKKKSKELAMILVCGGTYLQLVQFLFIQTTLLLICSIPLGILLGYLSFPLLSYLLSYMAQYPVNVILNQGAIVSTVVVMFFEILWCTVLNLGYAYRNSVKNLLFGELKVEVKAMPIRLNFHISRYVYVVLFVGSALLLYGCGNNTKGMFVFGILGIVGLAGCFGHVVIPFLDQYIEKRWIDQDEKIVYLGFLREDLRVLKSHILLCIATAVLLVTMMAFSIDNSMETTLALVSYTVMNSLLALSLMFRFSTEVVGRKHHFLALERIGYVKKKQKSIIRKELLCFYGLVIGVSCLYIMNVLVVLNMRHLLSLDISLGILIVFIVPIVICGFLNEMYYCNSCL